MSVKCRRCGGSGLEPDAAKLGREIRKAREQLGIGVRALARTVGCSPAYVSDLELGRRGAIGVGPKTRAIMRFLKLK